MKLKLFCGSCEPLSTGHTPFELLSPLKKRALHFRQKRQSVIIGIGFLAFSLATSKNDPQNEDSF
jgi:hypothetical protein